MGKKAWFVKYNFPVPIVKFMRLLKKFLFLGLGEIRYRFTRRTAFQFKGVSFTL
jgi:hypothetical protein